MKLTVLLSVRFNTNNPNKMDLFDNHGIPFIYLQIQKIRHAGCLPFIHWWGIYGANGVQSVGKYG
jgi:hypothetical protein